MSNSAMLTDGTNSSFCSKNRCIDQIEFDCYCRSFLLSSIGGLLLAVSERFIGGKGGLVRLETPAVELNGVRGLVI